MRRAALPEAALVALLVLSGCGARAVVPAAPVPLPLVELSGPDVTALAALLRMEDRRALDTALVSRMLAHPTAEVRARAALAAARVRGPGATALLLRAVGDEDDGVRTRAAFALGLNGDTTAAVFSALGRIALHDRPTPAIEAVGALGRLGTHRAVAWIDSVLSQTRYHPALRNEALTVAWRLPRDSAVIERLVRHTMHADAEARWRAAYALARTGSPTAAATLIGRTRDDDARVRANAVRALRAAHADSAGVRDSAFTTLLAAVRDSHSHVRINALRLLPAYGSLPRGTAALIAGLRDEDANVALAAAQALAESRAAEAVSDLSATAAAGARPVGLRVAALASLLRIDTASAVRVALSWSDSAGPEQWVLRRQAARTLAAATWPEVSARLERLARDEHHLVATESLNAVRELADSLPDARRIFIEQLAAPHLLVRAAALRGLARQAGPADLELFLQAWAHARHDAGRDAALAALDGLRTIAGTGTPVHRAFYLRFGGDGAPDDPRLYQAIVDRIGEPPAGWSPPAPAPAARPDDFYADIVRRHVVPALRGAALPLVVISTQHGEIELELAAADAPLTVHNFLSLIGSGYYTGTRWHRVVPNFVIQDGDPRGDGSGGPGYSIRDEINMLRYERGTLGMALSGPDTGGSQFFITHSPQPHLDGGYTVFGRVRAGMEVVDQVVQEEPITGMRIAR